MTPGSLALSTLRAAMVVFFIGALPGGLSAQAADVTMASGPARDLATGVSYRVMTDARGPWMVHVVRVDLRRARVDVRAVRATDQMRGRERTSAMSKRVAATGATVLAAVNADFFSLMSGENENNQVINGEWWKGLKVTDSPYDTYDNVHVQFAVSATGRPVIDRLILDGKAWARGAVTPIISVNANPSGTPEGTALYTARFGAFAPRDTTRVSAEATLVAAGRRGDTALFVRRGALSTASGTAIPADGAVLAAYGARTKDLQVMAEGDTVRILLTTMPRLPGGAAPKVIVGGWPRILHAGVNVAGDAATIEGTISRNAEVRHPRTAIGYSRDRRVLWLLAVDGRLETSVGMTLVELADTMRRLGAWDAMNFDGGGSTTMVVNDVVVNRPSDTSGERAVGNALLIVRKPGG